MSEEERLARALLGALLALHDALLNGFSVDRLDNMFHLVIQAGLDAMDLDNTESQLLRLKDELGIFLHIVQADGQDGD